MTAYDDRPETARVPLTSEDVEALLLTDGAGVSGQPRRVRHLLSRMRATFAAHADVTRSLQRDLEMIAESGKRRSNPVTAALDALAALSLEDQRLVFDRRAQSLIDAVEHSRREAAAARVAAASETNRARLVLAHVLSSPDLPDGVRAQLSAALEQLPLMRQPVEAPLPQPQGGFVTEPAAVDLGSELFG